MKSSGRPNDAVPGQFELYCLMAVARLGDSAYGAAVHEKLQLAFGRPISLSQVYLALGRMENKGFVSSAFGEPEAIRGGRRKRVFTLTGAGHRAIRDAERIRTALGMNVAHALGGASA